MEGWINFWGALLLVTLIIYTVLVLYVAIGGVADIRGMFRSLSRNENSDGSDSQEQKEEPLES
ncbi:MAG: hypothetical protein CMO73_07225 [Verrucomicrobiales bacterium]|jgi:hypothetical protein|nr:hypothetical protein [Verrucomicrobiales bacterium]MEC9037460.1 hypothetical protein [Verrucomicrobiota bacterium]MED5472123.1 hypothetical protein [Verrucomicrobiota bacterium]